jgi:hypothetical protein
LPLILNAAAKSNKAKMGAEKITTLFASEKKAKSTRGKGKGAAKADAHVEATPGARAFYDTISHHTTIFFSETIMERVSRRLTRPRTPPPPPPLSAVKSAEEEYLAILKTFDMTTVRKDTATHPPPESAQLTKCAFFREKTRCLASPLYISHATNPSHPHV